MELLGIPMPPSMNHAYPSNKSGRRFKSKEMTLWERDFNIWAALNFKTIKEARLTFFKQNKIQMKCVYWFKKERIICANGNSKKLDLDNRAKPLLDAVTKMIGFDDSNIWHLTLIKNVGEKDCCDIELFENYIPV